MTVGCLAAQLGSQLSSSGFDGGVVSGRPCADDRASKLDVGKLTLNGRHEVGAGIEQVLGTVDDEQQPFADRCSPTVLTGRRPGCVPRWVMLREQWRFGETRTASDGNSETAIGYDAHSSHRHADPPKSKLLRPIRASAGRVTRVAKGRLVAMTKTNPVLTDLNLLRVFLAISDLHSLTAAGERLGLTQPAVSHALRRLRTLFDDPLFVRTPQGMAPTNAARQLHAPLTQAFSIINTAVQQIARFDPATANRVFRVSMSDMAEFFFLPPLLTRLADAAPGIRLEIASVDVESISAAMRAGEVDLALGYVPSPGSDCVSQTLFCDEHVCMVRAGHPLRKRAPTREELMALRYVYASSNATGHRMVEEWLNELKFTRTVVLRLPHFIVAPEIVQHTDLAVIFPRSIAERFNRARSFRIFPLPFALPPIQIQLHSHVQFSTDPGLAWLRQLVYDMFHRRGA